MTQIFITCRTTKAFNAVRAYLDGACVASCRIQGNLLVAYLFGTQEDIADIADIYCAYIKKELAAAGDKHAEYDAWVATK